MDDRYCSCIVGNPIRRDYESHLTRYRIRQKSEPDQRIINISGKPRRDLWSWRGFLFDEGRGYWFIRKQQTEIRNAGFNCSFTLLLFRSARSIELFNQFIKSLFPFVFVF